MYNAMSEINSQREKSGQFSYQIGIGLSSGSFMAGPVGDSKFRMDFAILGDTIDDLEKLA